MPHHAMLIRREDTRNATPDLGPMAGPPATFEEMPGKSEWYRWHGVRVHFQREGAGPPLVLVHMVDIGASCIEWRRNMSFLSQGFNTYAVDLPGFGLSDLPDEAPRAALYVRFLTDFLNEIRSRHAEAPCVIGSGAAAAYLATLSQTMPSAMDRMILVAPTGISVCKPSALGAVAFHALRFPLLSSFAAGGSTRTGIFEHLKHDVYGDEDRASMSEAEARYYVAHRPGADAIERARVAGLLNVDLKPVISRVMRAVLVWGRKATCPPVEDLEVWRDLNSNTRLHIFEKSGLCPHFEEPHLFNEFVWEVLGAEIRSQAA
jgi:pimeloyl-ACP methyl ester carboxylesterase